MNNLVYQFDYDGKHRKVVVTSEIKGRFTTRHTITGWDFTAGGFRTFDVDKAVNLEILPSKFVKILPLDDNQVEEYTEAGYQVFVNQDNDVMYVVKNGN